MAIASLADVEAVERIPLADRIPASSTYEILGDVAARFPDKLALRFIAEGFAGEPVRDLTFSDLRRQTARAANLFRSLGAEPGSAVSSLLPILPETFVAMFGAQTAAAANPINFFLESEHVAALLRAARTRVLLAPDPDLVPGVWAKVEAIRPHVPTLEHVLRVGGPAHRPGSGLHFETELARQPAELAFERTRTPEDVASFFHTGGTTSAPKLARHTQRGLALMSWTNAYVLDCGPDDVLFNGLPPFHVGGAHCAGLAPLSQGATVVLLTPSGLRNRNVIANFWAHVERFRPTILAAVPTGWSAILSEPSEGHDLSSVRLCNAGGSSLPLELARAIVDRLGTPIIEGWGMTELHGFATMNPAAGESRVGSVGLRTPYTELATVVLDGKRIARRAAPDEIGQVLVRGYQVFGGYEGATARDDAWVEPETGDEAPVWSPGGHWLDTGDLGRLDSDGYLWLTGRAKDLIVRGGHNIDPLTIEHALQKHPAVEMAAAVGRPDAYAGELPMCFVQLKPGVSASGDELRDFARENVSERAAAPVEVVVLTELPLTGVGKIFKPELRRVAARLALERVVRSLAGGDAEVTVETHPVHGTLATIRLDAPADDAVLETVRRELDRFTIRCELLVESRANV